jgi:hypothetical protein
MSNKLDAKVKEVNEIQILTDRDYDWIWDYAQFRFNQGISDINKAEEKAGDLLKLVIYGFGAFWALFVYSVKEHNLPLGGAFNLCVLMGLAGLCLSAFFVMLCLIPGKRMILGGEELAIQFINENPETSRRPKGRFALYLKICSDFQARSATWKSWFVLISFIFLVVSLVLLFSGFYSWMLLWKT